MYLSEFNPDTIQKEEKGEIPPTRDFFFLNEYGYRWVFPNLKLVNLRGEDGGRVMVLGQQKPSPCNLVVRIRSLPMEFRVKLI